MVIMLSLPLKENQQLGDNCQETKKRAFNVLKQLQKDPKKLQKYDDMQEQLTFGVIEEVGVEDNTEVGKT